jgi:signal transduction histidine kinase
VVVALIVGAVASLAVPGLHVRVVAPALNLVLDTVTTLVTLSVAALGWVRYRERGEPVALFQAAAFLVLAIANGLTLGLATSGLDARTGMALSAPGQAPLYVFTLARLLVAGLLVVGGLAGLRHRHPRRPLLVLFGSALAVLLLIALVEAGAASLPPLGSVAAATGAAGASAPGTALPSPTLLGASAGVLVAGLYLWAAALSRRLCHRDLLVADGYLAVGLVVAAFAQVANAMYPGTYTGLVTSGDLLRLAFDVILLLGIQADMRATLVHLRLANADLARLQDVEVERAALAERAHLSRELHDGVAQNLWLAKLKAGRLAALPDLGPEASALTDELGEAIDAGLSEARQAVAAMRLAGEPVGTLRELLSRSVDDFADRFGLRVEFDCTAGLPPLTPRAQAEALRVAQEALTNVRRHADATVVHVRAAVEDGRLVVVISDNGCGFDPATVGVSAFGLAGMRERAAIIGAELHIDSAPQDGTRVSLLVPLALAGTPASTGAP